MPGANVAIRSILSRALSLAKSAPLPQGKRYQKTISTLPRSDVKSGRDPYRRGNTIPLCDWYFPFLSL